MLSITKSLKSRTNWTIAATFIINALQANMNLFPPEVVQTLNTILAVMAIYFRVTPQQHPE